MQLMAPGISFRCIGSTVIEGMFGGDQCRSPAFPGLKLEDIAVQMVMAKVDVLEALFLALQPNISLPHKPENWAK